MANLSDITIPYELPRNYPPTMQGGPNGRQGEMTFDIGLNDLNAFITFIGGEEETITLPDATTTTRLVPLQHPDDDLLYAVSYSSVAFGKPGGTGSSIYTPMFSHARVRVGFESLAFPIVADQPMFTLTTDHAAIFETIPGGALVFPSGWKSTGDYGIRVGCIAYSLTTYMSLQPVNAFISNMVGKVNSVELVLGDTTFAPGTMRFDSVRSEFSRGMFSQTLIKNFNLKYREVTWQAALDNTGSWEIPLYPGPGLPKFQETDLNYLKF